MSATQAGMQGNGEGIAQPYPLPLDPTADVISSHPHFLMEEFSAGNRRSSLYHYYKIINSDRRFGFYKTGKQNAFIERSQ